MVSDVLEFYPDPQLALRLWTVYIKSVDPVLKILHIPTAQSAVVATILDPKSAGSSTVALTFAIYFAAVTAFSHDDQNEPIELPCEKSVLLKRYRMSLDRLLLVPDLMNRPEMTALQALAIYVVSAGSFLEINYVPLLGWHIQLTTSDLDLFTGIRNWPECMGLKWAGDPARPIDWHPPRWCLPPSEPL